MEKKPFEIIKEEKYEEFSAQLKDPFFKLQIIFLSGVIGKINYTNIQFQNQSLEIQSLKEEIKKCLLGIITLYI